MNTENLKDATLFYIHDPMCSWCWGFQKTWMEVQKNLPHNIQIEYLVGGLAPDSNETMPKNMQTAISGYWQTIQEKIPGTEFNYDFWEKCQPRRSTYPACRAVLAAKQLEPTSEPRMIHAIQSAYYLNAKNPSDEETLVECAQKIGLDSKVFLQTIKSDEIEAQLQTQINLSRSMGAQGFPSLLLKKSEQLQAIFIDYNNPHTIIEQIEHAIA
ncbi:MAG: DsbA family protein [Arenicella sp.]